MQRDLVQRAMAGDHDAFSELARVSIGRLYAAAWLILRDDQRAQDATQEALVAAWRDLSALRDPDRYDAWIRRLLVRSCYREARQGKRRWAVEVEIIDADGIEPDVAIDFADRDQIERGFPVTAPVGPMSATWIRMPRPSRNEPDALYHLELTRLAPGPTATRDLGVKGAILGTGMVSPDGAKVLSFDDDGVSGAGGLLPFRAWLTDLASGGSADAGFTSQYPHSWQRTAP